MCEKNGRRPRFRFSMKMLIGCVSLLAICLGGWITISKYRMQKIQELRQQGAIVIIRDRTPKTLQKLGLTQLSPFYDVPTVELYITPISDKAKVGDSEELLPRDRAQKTILDLVAIARSYGAEDLHLIFVDGFDEEWMRFAKENSLVVISDSKQRYDKRLQANRDSGANINPQRPKTPGSSDWK